MRYSLGLLLALVLVPVAGCSDPAVAPVDAASLGDGAARDTGPRDTGALDSGSSDTGSGDSGPGDTGALDAGPADANVDAAPDVDAGPRPLFESVDDRTVPLSQRIGCPPALAFEADGAPLLAISNGTVLQVVHLVAGAWAQLGPDVNDAGTTIDGSQCPDLVVASDGARYVAFQQFGGGVHRARVRRLSGTSWVDEVSLDGVGGALAIQDLDLALDPAGQPVVALLEPNPGTFAHSITVRRRVGTAFVQDGGFGGLGVAHVRIAIRPDGSVVAFVPHAAGFSTGLALLELHGSTWTDHGAVDGVGDTTQFVNVGNVAVDATRAWVTWMHSTSAGAHVVHVSRFASGAYTAIDTTTVAAQNPELAIHTDDDLTWVYTIDNHLQVVAHDGTSFGAPADGPMVVYLGHLAWDHDQLYLAYTTSFGGGSANAELVRVNLP